DFSSMFIDEARLAARIRHPNVVATLDVVAMEQELLLVMDYVQGESLSRLLRTARQRQELVPLRILTTTLAGILHGLHAAHEAKTERGERLEIVHRDVSPQNILVGSDGVARVLDFGVAKAAVRMQSTREGQIKGKLSYMAPEQLRGDSTVDRRVDVYAAGVVLWEGLVGKRLFEAENEGRLLTKILLEPVPSPQLFVPTSPRELNDIVMKALARNRDERFATAREMAQALETVMHPANATEIGEWVERLAGSELAGRADRVSDIESRSDIHEGLVSMAAALSGGPVSVASRPRASAPDLTPSGANAGPNGTMTNTGNFAVAPISTLDLASSRSSAVVPLQSPHRSKWIALALAVAAIFLVAIGIVLGASSRKTADAMPPEGTQGPKASDSATGGSGVVAEPPPTTAQASSQATASAAPTDSVAVEPTARPHPSVAATHSTAPTSRPTTRVTPPSPPKNCNPPFTIDASGIRHFKPECG
ncbi:MAG: protein kinase, partial [Polyangiaceae bacterium]